VKRPAALLFLAVSVVGCDGPSSGTSWSEAFDASQVGWLLDTCGPSPDDLYAVGGTESTAAVMHFDGKTWSPLDLGVSAPLLNWCHAFSSSDVTMVGNAGTVLHWDGAAWTQQPTPTTQNLWGVWGAAPGDLWSVGGDGLADGQATLLHYDGSAWSAVMLPPLQKANVWQLLKVWGTSADDVYVVGQRGVVLHWDGASWSEELVGASDDLVSLWGTGPDRVVAVGGRSNAIVSVWDGAAWKTTSLAPTPGLDGVWMRNPGVAHVVGTYGTLGDLDLATMTLTTVSPPPTQLDFHSIFGDASGAVHAVGGNLAVANPPQYEGVAYTRLLGSEE
jgi:hypothetical protein